MPPVLHVAFEELARRAAQQVLARERGSACTSAIDVLQLVAEAEGAARLVVAAARPQAAGQRLVEQPAVGQHVEGAVGRLDLHRAERALPVLLAPFERSARCRLRKRCTSAACRVAPTPSVKTISRSWPSASSKATCIAAHGSSPAPTLPESARARIAAGLPSVPLRPRNSVRSPVTRRLASSTSKNATRSGELGVVGVARAAARRSPDRSR